jgi:small conductance mechanosensitive channel
MEFFDFLEKGFLDFVKLYWMKLLSAIIILIIGWISINLFSRFLRKKFAKSKKISPSLESFLVALISVTFKILLIITVVSMAGVQVTSFIAVLGAAGLAVGLALQGSLSNFAGGVLILLLHPFEVGDHIEAQGHSGIVSEIQIFNTILKTFDNETIILPNSAVSNGNIINYTKEEIRRLNLPFGISYRDNIDKARKIIEDLLKKDKRVIKNDSEHPIQVVVSGLGDSSVNLDAKFWIKREDYWDVKFAVIEGVKKEFDRKGISIPFPQRDVHLSK